MSQLLKSSGLGSSEGIPPFIHKQVFEQTKIPFTIKLSDERCYHFGKGEPSFEVIVNDRSGMLALSQLDELKICEAYLNGSLDITGDMLQALGMRDILTDRQFWHKLWLYLSPLFLGRISNDRQAIAQHYEFDSELYLTFLGGSRCYSHALFERDDEPLDTAQSRKLQSVIDICRLKEGDRVLDVGGGWGTFTEYAGRRGIQVTSLTISQKSWEFITKLIEELGLPCRVLNQHFLEHESKEPYDAIAILGVMEHLPDYPAVLKQFQHLLKPGGRVYLDFGASRRNKYGASSFVTRYIFPGYHSFVCLHDLMAAIAKTPFELQAVYNDTRSYFLTSKAWAEALEAAREPIISRSSEFHYRLFRLHLWGSAHAFLSKRLEAYRVVLDLPDEK